MFIGHFAVGLASKKLAPRTSLVWLLMAPLLLDLLWPFFLIAGIERVSLIPDPPTPFLVLGLDHYPWSHSLVMALVWSVGFGLLVGAVARDRRGAVVAGVGVFSHWVLDYVTHRPDMQLYPGGEAHVGLGLWYSTAGTIGVELAMYAAAAAIYLSATRGKKLAIVSLLVFLLVMYVAATFGPPPPNVDALKYAALASWIVVPWAWWIERSRSGGSR